MKINEVLSEAGFLSGLGKSLLPRALRTVADAGPAYAEPTDIELAKVAANKFGDNPQSEIPGALGWLTQQQQKALIDAKEKEARKKERQQQRTKQSKGTQRLAKDVFGAPAAQSTTPASTQSAPPQVRLPSGQYVTKYGSSWYDEAGQRIVIPGDVDRLERMARGPAGQSQMSATKNAPATSPEFKGKRK